MPEAQGSHFGLALDELDERDEAFGRGNFLLVTEGASDAAAGCSLGLTTIGRASANPGLRADRGALRACRGRDIVVVPDADAAGLKGGPEFAARAMLFAKSVRLLVPPREAKDLREWLLRGLTHDELLQQIESSPPLRPSLEDARGTR